MRALLTQKQIGKSTTLLEKILEQAEKDIDGFELEERKFGVKTIMDFMPYIMRKDTAPLVQINNNTQNNQIGSDIPLQKLVDFMAEREKKIEALEHREQTRQLKTLEASKKLTGKLPANLPINS